MVSPLAFGVKLLITLVALVLVPSWKVDSLHMNQRIAPLIADLSTQHTLELSNVLSLSEFDGVPLQALSNLFSIFPSVNFILHLHAVFSNTTRTEELMCSMLFLCLLNSLGQSGFTKVILMNKNGG